MKRVFALLMVIFLIFSLDGFSNIPIYKPVDTVRAEQSVKGKAGRRPRKPISKKIVRTKAPKGHSRNKSGNRIII